MRPRNAAALCGMATTYASLGEFELAVQFFNEALGVAPQNQVNFTLTLWTSREIS